MSVVVVESPAKAKTINKYLGSDYHVIASYGHIRDLPPKDGSVLPEKEFDMLWEVDARGSKRVNDIIKALKGHDRLILATDPDREGEAISWHVLEVLRKRNKLDNLDVQRVVFHEITRSAVLEAMEHPRQINNELVEAYLARRALDYLVGFSLSPVLWRKLPGSRSAGRVQSVALRQICDREAEVEAFKPQEYWSVEAVMASAAGQPFTARLSVLEGRKVERHDLAFEAAAAAAKAAIESAATTGGGFRVAAVDNRTVRRNPAPPFTTSTLQQEASRKLRFSASRTMQIAQKLYEGVAIDGEGTGLITYMRTDSVTLSNEAVSDCRRVIADIAGAQYVPEKPRIYRTRAKNAQEAHEAIRPTALDRSPDRMRAFLAIDELRLYELIWKRTIACEMASAIFDQATVDIASPDAQTGLRAVGSVLRFDGFLRLYQEDSDDSNGNGTSDRQSDSSGEDSGKDSGKDGGGRDERDRRLPALASGENTTLQTISTNQHFTQPPPRYTEASLVKKMEELGIGRPSTYASILKVLQDRDYVRLDRRRFVPEDRGRIVTAFLSSFFARYVEDGFTSDLEEKLDEISAGRLNRRDVLREFWGAFSDVIGSTTALEFSDVVTALDKELGPHFFPSDGEVDAEQARRCPACSDGRLSLRLGRHRPFIGCDRYPDCRYVRSLAANNGDASEADVPQALLGGPMVLGTDPETGLEVSLRKGPFGIYVQLGDTPPAEKGKRKKVEKPKRSSLPKTLTVEEVTLEIALKLLALPRELGAHPETGGMITAGLGRYGPYLRHQGRYASLGAEDDVLSIGINRAVTIIAESKSKGRGREIGTHPEDGKPVTVLSGRYGPYVKHGAVNATLPAEIDPDTVDLEIAIPLIEARRAKGAGKRKPPARKTSAKKTTAKKTATRQKNPAKKTGVKKDQDSA